MNDQPKKGCGCCGAGCVTVIVVAALLLLGASFGAWHYYSKSIDTYTSAIPATIRVAPPTATQYSAANAALERLRNAIASGQEATVEFTAADLNALIARDPDFAWMRGKFRIAIDDSIMTLDLSVPLGAVRLLPKLRNRWFNGTIRFSFDYDRGEFSFDPKSAEAGGQPLPDIVLSSRFTSSFDSGFSKGFRETMGKSPRGAEFWKHIDTMRLRGDKLIVTTNARTSNAALSR
jgi:hypothetical protein